MVEGVIVETLSTRDSQPVTITLRMPFKSQAQRRKFAQLLVEGKISNETYEEWNRETGGRKLPERVKKKAKAASRGRPKKRGTARSKR
jgi:CRISPR/Cas system-associated endonuclease Cas1